MGDINEHGPALLMLPVYSRYPEALQWATERTVGAWGPLAMQSDVFAFKETDYYEAEMGTDVQVTILAFEKPFDPAILPVIKHATNRWEVEYATQSGHDEPRPLNLDPGYLTEAKLVLASTKDHQHRIYLSDGIYAEVTLHFQKKQWRDYPWTYPNYRRPDYHDYLNKAREYLRKNIIRPRP